jgi:uncharacterized membrane protein
LAPRNLWLLWEDFITVGGLAVLPMLKMTFWLSHHTNSAGSAVLYSADVIFFSYGYLCLVN